MRIKGTSKVNSKRKRSRNQMRNKKEKKKEETNRIYICYNVKVKCEAGWVREVAR